MYFGEMIVSSIDDAYRYERWLARFIEGRNRLFSDTSTFWGRNRYDLINLSKRMNFPAQAYHPVPGDPLVLIPEYYWDMIVLKRRYLNRLRQKFMKEHRR